MRLIARRPTFTLLERFCTSSSRVTGEPKKSDIAQDIGFVVRKALRVEPDERYATVDAFAEDVRAFLENRPVRARAGNAWYRARKFVRRYWVPVTASAVAVIGLSTGLYVANRERSIAEQRFLQVRQLANKVFDIDVAIRNTPGTTKARQLIVSTSLEYLQKVGAEARGDKDLVLEIGSAYVQLAHVQGVPDKSQPGPVRIRGREPPQGRRAGGIRLEIRPEKRSGAAHFGHHRA